MRRNVRAALLLAISLCASEVCADVVFNLRASLANGYNVTGTVSVDVLTGVITNESAALYDHGSLLATFGAPVSQGIFSPGGLAPSYLFGSLAPNNYLFVGSIPATSLVGYGGSELCSTGSTVHCAASDLFLGGAFQANVTQGILAPTSDAITVFDLTGTFANGDNVTGTVTIDTTLGYVLDENASLFSHGVLLSTFTFPNQQGVFAPGGLTPSYLFGSVGTGDFLLNISLPGASLAGYTGGDICAVNTGLNCAFSDIFSPPMFTSESDALTGRLSLPSPIPEPATLSLIGLGLAGLGFSRRRR